MTPIWFPIVLSAAGIIIGPFFNNYIKRPKLTHTGSGGGGGPGPGYYRNCINIANSPGFLGVRVGETVIFGKRILPPIPAGLLIDRNIAKGCTAWIYEMPENRAMTVLWWQIDGKMVQHVTLDAGDSAWLMLFARTEADPLHYFLYQPQDAASSDAPKISAAEVGWRTKQSFRIRISDAYDRTLLTIPITIRPDHDGRLRWEIRGGSGGL